MYIYFFTIIISVVTICLGLKKENFVRNNEYINFTEDWYSDNEKININEIYKYDEISKIIPDLDNDKRMYLIVKSMLVDVYIEDEKIYSYEDYNKEIYGKTPGTYFIDLNINKDYSGKEIKLKLNNVYNDKSGKITNIYLGNSGNIVSNFVSEHLSGIIFSTIIIFIGMIYLALYFVLRKHKLTSIRLFNLGLFALFMGIFMFTDSKCLQVLSGNEYIYHVISQVCMLLIVVPIMQFIGRAYENICNKKVINILSIIGVINFGICFCLNIFNICDYHESLIFTHITYILCILYIFYLCIKSLIDKNKKGKYHTIGFLFICICCLLDIVLFHFFSIVESSFFTRIGVLAFLCFEGYQFSLDFLILYKGQQRAALLQKLAYEDGLTGLLNRTSFMNDMQILKNSKEGLVAVFDVNGLKKVNDNYGHTEGDNLILTMSNVMKEYLTKLGNCYRIGGDEFVFISSQKNIEGKFKTAYKNLLSYLNSYNKNSGKKYDVSFAMGYSNISDDININEAFNLADEKMYKNKAEMKKKK